MTASFLEFVLSILRAECEGIKAEIYDEREKSLTWIVSEKFASISGVAVVVSLPKIDRISGETPAGRGHRLSVLVTLRCNPVLAQGVNSFELAERLYRRLDGERWQMPGSELSAEDLEPNVQTDQLRSTMDGDNLHTFIVSTAVIQF